mgnify:FL=1|tara:strand:+ start:1162 stop:1386 length:225 start_codon:yes stop_codon:yes gene_type:complete
MANEVEGQPRKLTRNEIPMIIRNIIPTKEKEKLKREARKHNVKIIRIEYSVKNGYTKRVISSSLNPDEFKKVLK